VWRRRRRRRRRRRKRSRKEGGKELEELEELEEPGFNGGQGFKWGARDDKVSLQQEEIGSTKGLLTGIISGLWHLKLVS